MKKHHIMQPMTWEKIFELYGEGFFPEWQKKQVCKLKDKFFGFDSEDDEPKPRDIGDSNNGDKLNTKR